MGLSFRTHHVPGVCLCVCVRVCVSFSLCLCVSMCLIGVFLGPLTVTGSCHGSFYDLLDSVKCCLGPMPVQFVSGTSVCFQSWLQSGVDAGVVLEFQ